MGMAVGLKGVVLGVLAVLAVMFFWWKDIIFESITEKVHNKITEVGLRFGMALFIASEVMFFVAFFWRRRSILSDRSHRLCLASQGT